MFEPLDPNSLDPDTLNPGIWHTVMWLRGQGFTIRATLATASRTSQPEWKAHATTVTW